MDNNNDDLTTQYNDILERYSQQLNNTPPKPDIPAPVIPPHEPIDPVPPLVPAPPEIPSYEPEFAQPVNLAIAPSNPKPSNFFKILFFISLLVFLGVASAITYTFFFSKKSNVNLKLNTTPTENPSPSASAQTCELNDKKYPIGESFPATDGCNTCTCDQNLMISCTEKKCPTATPTKKPTPITVSSVFPTSGKSGSQITVYGTGFDKTTNTVVFASSNNCSFFYKDIPSTDSQKIVLQLAVPSEIICNNTTIVKPTKLVQSSYDVSVNIGSNSSYNKAKLIKFKFVEPAITKTPSVVPTNQ